MKVHGRIAYASQQAWVYNGSVKENIIFGKDFDEVRYKEVIKVCALQRVGSFFPMRIENAGLRIKHIRVLLYRM